MKSETDHEIYKFLIISKKLKNGISLQEFFDFKFESKQPF